MYGTLSNKKVVENRAPEMISCYFIVTHSQVNLRGEELSRGAQRDCIPIQTPAALSILPFMFCK